MYQVLMAIYALSSIVVPFRGDYVGLRRNPLWRDTLKRNRLHRMDRRVVFADIVNKINRSNGKVEEIELPFELRSPKLKHTVLKRPPFWYRDWHTPGKLHIQ